MPFVVSGYVDDVITDIFLTTFSEQLALVPSCALINRSTIVMAAQTPIPSINYSNRNLTSKDL